MSATGARAAPDARQREGRPGGQPLGSKAETLDWLSGRLATASVPKLVYFSTRDWERAPEKALRRIAQLSAPRLAVRSSATGEDRPGRSLAGRFVSRLGVVNEAGAIAVAIGEVVRSYEGGATDQVLVQEMVSEVATSGVVLTRDPETGAPYYLVEYHEDATRTDVVTSGCGPTRSVWIHHAAPIACLRSPRLLRQLAAVREIETTCGRLPLEIEFADSPQGAVFVLQVRALAAPPRRAAATLAHSAQTIRTAALALEWHGRPLAGVVGRRNILGQMPDWNPAELIGARPSPLAASLFRFLVGDQVWRRARAAMGYAVLPEIPLVHLLLGRPYVDVRASFNSFLPRGLGEGVRAALVDAWLDRLEAQPELHDRVELEVVQTALDLDFVAEHRRRFADLLPTPRRDAYREALRAVTNHALGGGSLTRSLAVVARLGRETAAPAPGDAAGDARERGLAALLHCRERGTLPFAIVARHAFIATALLRSAARRGALAPERLAAFHRSLRTVVTELASDLAAVGRGRLDPARFRERHGHLRPGTFEIASLRYDQRTDLFSAPAALAGRAHAPPEPFVPSAREKLALEGLLREARLVGSAAGLLRYARLAITGRERAKLAFTRSLSAALEELASWGRDRELSRDEVSYLDLDDLIREPSGPGHGRRAPLREQIQRRRAAADRMREVRLSHLLCGPGDLWVSPDHATRPSFVTARTVVAPPVLLHPRLHPVPEIAGRVVCIESADPGYDWIFARPLAGLVTGFGGGNSHMTIRCIERDLPAALGVGPQVLARLAESPSLELRCGEGIVRSIWPDVLA